jgi:hypothetical protein
MPSSGNGLLSFRFGILIRYFPIFILVFDLFFIKISFNTDKDEKNIF